MTRTIPLPTIAATVVPSAIDTGVFARKLHGANLFPLRAQSVTTLQVNVGKRCNQACHHCHVEAGPQRTEEMTRETAELCIAALRRHPEIELLDITGGAPELNPNFRFLAREGRRLGRRVMDRCNLTILFEPGQDDLAELLAENRIEITASLPCYGPENTDEQRGGGVFEKSIRALHILNALGYGQAGSGLILNLVYNPNGAFLPPAQADLELDYKKELRQQFDIVFNALFTITNLPIRRFAHYLRRTGEYDGYMRTLADAFNPDAAQGVMCRTLVSVGYDGLLYDCDFNQMLDLPVTADADNNLPRHIRDFDAHLLARRTIAVADHCLGCTAGAGSSCGGSLA